MVVPAALVVSLNTRRNPFTRRAAIFASVLLLVAISVAYPAQRYVAQRRHIADLHARVAASAVRVAALQHESTLRAQNFYVEREARLRLHYVMPGEQAFRVSDPPPADAGDTPAAVSPLWWNRLLASMSDAATPVEQLPTGNRHAP
ncbi:MAG TPA: septum formation initiator family protein [Sporichthyaceae bacterium]|jgi:cell division protein FtsB